MSFLKRPGRNKPNYISKLLGQVMILFLTVSLVLAVITMVTIRKTNYMNLKQVMEKTGDDNLRELLLSLREYPAHTWLMTYWYEHAEELDIEYDIPEKVEESSERKNRLLMERVPGLVIEYAKEEDIKALSPEDQKLYAELIYQWILFRISQINSTNDLEGLYLYVYDEKANLCTVLFGFTKIDVQEEELTYLNKVGEAIPPSPQEAEAMKNGAPDKVGIIEFRDTMVFYLPAGKIDSLPVYAGVAYDITDMNKDFWALIYRESAKNVIILIAVGIITILHLYMIVLRPLGQVQKNIHIYRDDKDPAAAKEAMKEIRVHNEIGELARNISDLMTEIHDYVGQVRTVTAAKEKLETELSIASKIQQSALPDRSSLSPEKDGFDIYASVEPAREVGGDFYDFFMVDEDHLCMIIADVSGKGVPSALFMMMSKIVLANHAKMGKDPAQILQDANREICERNREEMFVTVWLGILELSTGALTASSAGHEYPAFRKKEGEFHLVTDSHGLVVGAFDGSRYKNYELLMEPGAAIFVYTDGVKEAEKKDRIMFGTERMLSALNKERDVSAEQLSHNVKEAVDAFIMGEEQYDDITMLCLVYQGRPGEE